MKRSLLILLLLILAAGCDQVLDEPAADEDEVVLVMVDGRPVTLPMLEVLMQIRGVGEEDVVGMQQLLDELIRIRVMANAAENTALADDTHVRAEREIKDMETLYVRFLEKYQRENPVDEEAIEQVYREQVERSGDRQYLIESILYPDQAAALNGIVRTEDEELDFEQLVEAARAQGLRVEEGVWVDRSQVPESFAAELVDTEVGELVPTPLQAGNEWRLVRLSETRPLEVPELTEVRDGIRRHLVREQSEAMIEERYEAADIVPMLPLEDVAE